MCIRYLTPVIVVLYVHSPYHTILINVENVPVSLHNNYLFLIEPKL